MTLQPFIKKRHHVVKAALRNGFIAGDGKFSVQLAVHAAKLISLRSLPHRQGHGLDSLANLGSLRLGNVLPANGRFQLIQPLGMVC